MHAYHILLPALAACALFGCGEFQFGTPESRERSAIKDKVHGMYDKARQQAQQAGTRIADNPADWVREDLKKIGIWEYRIVVIQPDDNANVELRLNDLGQDRWECYWMEKHDDKVTCYLKRSGRSLLRAIPASELVRMLSEESE